MTDHGPKPSSMLLTSQTPNGSDYLFMSYASEDAPFAEWLTLRLTSEGFRVWCDSTKLLGGESYPLDIDLAIKNSTFRVIALLSKHSLKKHNPVKERTLALNIGRDRKIDFLIPLNLDGLSPAELDWMTSDLTFIPFYQSWAEGLKRLLKKLNQIHAPRRLAGGKQTVAEWIGTEEMVVRKNEQLWSNAVPILEVPEEVRQYYVGESTPLDSSLNWPFFQRKGDEAHVWAFGPPPSGLPPNSFERKSVNWSNHDTVDEIRTIDLISTLLRQTLVIHCLKKGLLRSIDGEDVYFPEGLLSNDRLYFTRYDGKQVYVKVVGERSFRIAEDMIERSKYHLAPSFKPLLSRFGLPSYQFNLRILWTDLLGDEYARGKSNRRRRRLTSSWWNYQWLSRIMAVISWITDGQPECTLFNSEHGNVVMAGLPITTTSQVGIDEDAIPNTSEDDEMELLEDPSDGGNGIEDRIEERDAHENGNDYD
jgi:TIR domain-containing protein